MNKKTFSLSVDVEDFFFKKKISDTYLGKGKKDYFGVPKIIEIANQFDIKVTFFVDVENVENIVPQKTIKETCLIIHKSGHELGLHTHPPKLSNGKYKGRVLCNYDCDFQYNFIINGAKKIESWTGLWPKSHRAGSYGANEETYKALEKAGIFIDSSIFWDKRDFSFVTSNYNNIHPFKYKSINILPVTSYFLNLSFLPIKIMVNKKTDIEWCNTDELKSFIQSANINHIDLFMHSNSLINLSKSKEHFFYINNLKEMIKTLKNDYKPIFIKDIDYLSYTKLNKTIVPYDVLKYSLKDIKEIYLSKLF